MSGDEALHLEQQYVDAAGEQQADAHHEERRQLGRDRDEEEVGLHADLILSNGVRHGNQEGREIGSKIQLGKVVGGLRAFSQLHLPKNIQ